MNEVNPRIGLRVSGKSFSRLGMHPHQDQTKFFSIGKVAKISKRFNAQTIGFINDDKRDGRLLSMAKKGRIVCPWHS
ncbi:hypothetical protein [Zymomonas mobilis]|uniref:hypothetical protein n=1 Tax=Zymomonas mobilis TaxID=542 RepID=UPI00130E4ACD|nr:hypothetical protein [Zymomonas mobilis]MDX5949570.1 hypothetical protein [Zymomonas mobilis subsp. pomaceae]